MSEKAIAGDWQLGVDKRLEKVQFIGIMYFSFSVIVGKITYIVLSELNVLLQAYAVASDYHFLPGGFDDVSQPRNSGCTGISHRGCTVGGGAEVWFGFWLVIAYTCLVCFLSNSPR